MLPVNEIYQHGHHTSVVSSHAKRTAETDAAFFLPYLKPGMRLLDVGCGPGSITVGLALRVEPAHTVGIDTSESVIETARSLAKAKPVRHLTFEVGNIYEFPLPRWRSRASSRSNKQGGGGLHERPAFKRRNESMARLWRDQGQQGS